MASQTTADRELIVFEELTDFEMAQLDLPFDSLNETTRDAPLTCSVDEFIANQAKKNTQQATARDMKNVQRWLYDNRREPRLIEHIPPQHLNGLLCELFIGIRKSDGTNYEPTSLEGLKNSIERYLKEKNYQASLRDRVFGQCIRALTAKKMELKKLGKGNKPNKSMNITPEEEEKMYASGSLGSSSPKSLQFTVFYYFGKMFGLRDEARQLKFGDIQLKLTSNGEKFLEFNERVTKTRDGANHSNTRETTPKIFATENSRDPIKFFETFRSRRPSEMLAADSQFYLTPVPDQPLKGTPNEPWYYPRPMGEATLGSLMKNAAEQAGISSRLTNHSIRKSTVTTLSKAGVPPQKIMKITGHKNIQSITHYDAELSIGEHRKISNILQSGKNIAAPSRIVQSSQQIAPSATVSVPSNMDIEPLRAIENVPSTSSAPNFSTPSQFPATFLSGNTFNDCTFHFGNFGALPNQSEN